MSVIEKLRKRRFYPIQIDGETIHLRALLTSEQGELMAIKDDEESFGFAIGCCLLNADQSPVYKRSADESPKQFGARVLADIDIPTDTRTELASSIMKLSQGVKNPEQLAKN